MVSWDERYRAGEYPRDPAPSRVLQQYVDSFPSGRALDVATGPGRNAIFLAEHGYEVDAIDRSREGLKLACRNASDRSVTVNWIQADVNMFTFPRTTYDVVTISFFKALDRLADIKASLVRGGVLFYQHHLRSSEEVPVGPGDQYRFGSNELLRVCSDLTILYYSETRETVSGRPAATAQLVARKSCGARQSYPRTGANN